MFVKPEILVVCPTAAGRLFLGVLLGRLWYQPLLAKTVDEALHHAHRTRFAVITLDGDIPEESLQNTIPLLKNHSMTASVPLIVFSRRADSSAAGMLLRLGCESVLPRPIDFSSTYATLARLTGQVRQQARITLQLDVAVQGATFAPPPVCTNISEGGMFLRLAAPPAEGTVLRLGFTLPGDSEPIAASASVVSRLVLGTTLEQEPGVGLRFTELAEADLLRLRRFVHQRTLGDLRWD